MSTTPQKTKVAVIGSVNIGTVSEPLTLTHIRRRRSLPARPS